MKSLSKQSADATAAPGVGRRGMLIGAGATVAAGTVAAVAVRSQAEVPAVPAREARNDVDAEGYRLSDHVQRYYRTART